MSISNYIFTYLQAQGYTEIQIHPDVFSVTADVSAVTKDGLPCRFRAAVTRQKQRNFIVLSKV